MRNISSLLLIISIVLFTSCNKKIDNPQLIETLQKQVDSLIIKGYQIEKIDISSKKFSDHGSDNIGYLQYMFIYAASPDSTIKYLANFSCSGPIIGDQLTFHGYPTDSYNRRKDKTYDFKPDLINAISKLDEMKKQIPEDYTYENLLSIVYFITEDGQPVYEFKVELKPASEDISHPNVKKQELSYVTTSISTSRRKFGTTQQVSSTDVERKIQYTTTFRLINNQIEIH